MNEVLLKAAEQVPGLVVFAVFAWILVKAFSVIIERQFAQNVEAVKHMQMVIESNTRALTHNSVSQDLSTAALGKVSEAMKNCPAVNKIK
jgi:septation ring formation regulator EzrA